MNRQLPIYSQRTFLLEALSSLAKTTMEQDTAATNSLIQDCLISLTVEEMCAIVQEQSRAGFCNPSTILDQALTRISSKLHQPDSEQWSPYWQVVRAALKQPANQLEDLQVRLLLPEQRENSERQRVETEVEVPFEILHVPEIESVVAIPLQEGCSLALDQAQAHKDWVVSGEYYPFEIQIGDLTVIISSSGELVVQTQNFPESLIQQVIKTLREVAQTLYTNANQGSV